MRSMRYLPQARSVFLAAVALAVLAPALGAQPAADGTAASEPVLRQLEAFRRDDYDTAYTYASDEIRQRFDRASFERMVRGGYPEIARSTRAHVAGTRDAPDGRVLVVVKIRGDNGRQVQAIYEMVQDPGGWRINGVAVRPDPGEEA